MCQLLGLNCQNPTDATFSFTGFSQRPGITHHHADGWGIAFVEGAENDRGLRHFVEQLPANTSPFAELLRRYPIKSRNVISHIRKATQGQVALENCHPFVRELWGRYWVFAHNGNLENFEPRLHGSFRPVGQTDSEQAFCWLMQELAKSHASVPSVAELNLTSEEEHPCELQSHHDLVCRLLLVKNKRNSTESDTHCDALRWLSLPNVSSQ